MNPLEWLLFAAAFDVFSGPRSQWRSTDVLFASAQVLATLDRRA